MSRPVLFHEALTEIDVRAPPREYLAEVLGVICGELGYRCGSIIELDEHGRGVMISSYNLPADYPERANAAAPVLSSPSGEAIATGRLVVVSDLLADPRMAAWSWLAHDYGLKTIVWVPLKSKAKAFGSLVLYDPEVRELSAGEQQVLEQIAVNISIAIISNQYLDQLNKRTTELQREIAEREKVEQSLRESEGKLRAMLQSLTDAVSMMDRDLTITWANDAAVGLYVDDVVGLKCNEAYHAQDKPCQPCVVLQTFEDGRPRSQEVEIKAAGMRTCFTCTSSMALRDDEGRPTGVIGVRHDITEQRRTEEQREILMADLVRANKDLEDFAFAVSHDLRAPLRGITSVVGWLAESHADALDDEGRDYIALITGRAQRLNDLIDGILRYSRVGRTQARPEWLRCGAVVAQVIADLAPPPVVTVKTRGPLPYVRYDRLALQQVLQNLISNAIQHLGKPEGEVVVSSADAGDFWEICVRDNGVGIEERHFERIFKMFQTLKPRDETESTGIGLPLVKRIVERNGGTVRLEAVVGQGSAFFFTIPKQRGELRPAGALEALLVDPNPAFTEAAAKTLEHAGHTVLRAASRDEAREVLQMSAAHVDVAVVEGRLLQDEPLELCQELRRLAPGIKIVLCTDQQPETLAAEVGRLGLAGVLGRPFEIAELESIIRSVVAEPGERATTGDAS